MQFYSVSQTSLAKSGSSVVEEYIPLWQSDGGGVTVGAGSTYYCLQDGSTSLVTSIGSSSKLFTLNSNWSATQKYALEATIESSTSGNVMSAVLYDLTNVSTISNSNQVSGSAVSTTNASYTVVRSGQFTLVPGHIYGVGVSGNPSSGGYICDASLIVFG